MNKLLAMVIASITITMGASAMDDHYSLVISGEHFSALMDKQALEQQIIHNNALADAMIRMHSRINPCDPLTQSLWSQARALLAHNKDLKAELVSLHGILKWHIEMGENKIENAE